VRLSWLADLLKSGHAADVSALPLNGERPARRHSLLVRGLDRSFCALL
jgi:hypothetical protein